MNQVSLVGTVVQDPEERMSANNLKFSKFNVAVDRYFGSQKAERQSLGKPTADFPRIVVWGKQAEKCVKYLKKGSLISIEGKIITSVYEKEGMNIYSTEILGEKIKMLPSSKSFDVNHDR